MNVAQVARAKIDMFSICRRVILEQLNLVAARRFQYRKFQLCVLYSGDLLRPFAFLMRGM